MSGKVWLVGAGPGDVGLLTVKAKELIEKADFIAYDALISDEILCTLPEETEKQSVGKRGGNHLVPQEQINEILLQQALLGKKVVRLKGGDPFVFGRGGEELELLARHGIPFEIVPGITSAVAVPTYAGIPVTHREFTSSFHVITGHPRQDGNDRIDYKALVDMNATLVFLMSISRMDLVLENLVKAGMDKTMPAAVLERGTQFCQKRVVSTVENLVEESKKAEIKPPAIIVVGKVCSLEKDFAWYEKRALAGKQIVVTRTRKNNSKLVERLRELGAGVLEVPAISTKSLAVGKAQVEELLQGNSNPETWYVFTSPAGVEYFFEMLENENCDVRSLLNNHRELKVAAVGTATKKELRKYGFGTDLMPEEFNGENLGQELAKAADKDANIVVFGPKEAADGLTTQLDAASLSWKRIALYETIIAQNHFLSELLVDRFDHEKIDVVMFTSASTVKGFVKVLDGIDFTKVNAVCIGKQTAAEAKRYGMQVSVSQTASIDSMLEKVKEECHEK